MSHKFWNIQSIIKGRSLLAAQVLQSNLSITTTFIMQSIACFSFSEAIDADWG